MIAKYTCAISGIQILNFLIKNPWNAKMFRTCFDQWWTNLFSSIRPGVQALSYHDRKKKRIFKKRIDLSS